MQLVKTLALLHEAVSHAKAQRQGTPTMLVATDSMAADGPRTLYLMQRWLPLILSIRSAAPSIARTNPCLIVVQLQMTLRAHPFNMLCSSAEFLNMYVSDTGNNPKKFTGLLCMSKVAKGAS
jgi:hypothetical protein